MGLILLILVLVLLFGGGGGYYGYRRWGTGGGVGIDLLAPLSIRWLIRGQYCWPAGSRRRIIGFRCDRQRRFVGGKPLGVHAGYAIYFNSKSAQTEVEIKPNETVNTG
jgi:hypothetical protein